MRIFAFCFFLLSLIFFQSCGVNECGADKDAFLKQYSSFIEEAQSLDYGYSDAKWDAYDRRFKKYVEECYDTHEESLSQGEKQRFYGKMVKYYFSRYGTGVLAEIKDENSAIGKEVREQMSAIGEDMKEAFGDIKLNIDTDQVEGLLKDMGSDIKKIGKKWGEQIEDLIEDSKEE